MTGAARLRDRTRPPPVGRPSSLTPPAPVRLRLSNGLPVVLVPSGDLPLVAAELIVRGGSSTLSAERAGLSALVADMLDEGTDERSAVELARGLDAEGARFRSASGWDASFVAFDVVSGRLQAVLDLVGEMLRRPAFPGRELERVRRERLTRILQRRDRPGSVADDALARILYGRAHPYGQPLLGEEDTLEAITRDDVERYFRDHYHAGNATLVMAGDVSPETTEPMLERSLGGWRSGSPVTPEEPEAPTPAERRIHLVDHPGASQSQVRVGRIAAARTSERYFPLTVLNTVLGGSFTSRLNTRLREEKGYTYGASSAFVMRRWPGPWVAGASVHTPVTHDAIRELVREIRRLREEPVGAEELERARNYVAFRLPQRFETVRDVSTRFGEQVLYDLPGDVYETYVERVLAVDAADVREAAVRSLDPDRLTVVVVGDRRRIEEELRAAGVGTVVPEPRPGAGGRAAEPTKRAESTHEDGG